MMASAAIARRPHHRTSVQNLRRLTLSMSCDAAAIASVIRPSGGLRNPGAATTETARKSHSRFLTITGHAIALQQPNRIERGCTGLFGQMLFDEAAQHRRAVQAHAKEISIG